MPMLHVDTPKDLLQHIGRELGPSDWITVDQAMIDRFADATGDHQWIHVDVERARREMPGGKTIAHGYLTLSLIPRMAATLLEITRQGRGINYGSNKIRFISPVPAGSRVRLRQRIVNAEEVPGNGIRVTSEMTVEVEGQERPARVAADGKTASSTALATARWSGWLRYSFPYQRTVGSPHTTTSGRERRITRVKSRRRPRVGSRTPS